MLDGVRRVFELEVREGVRSALITYQQRVALRVVASALCAGHDADESAIGILSPSSRDTFGDDGAAVDTFGWFPNIIGLTYIDATTDANGGELIMGNIFTAARPAGGSSGTSTNINYIIH